MNSLLWLLLLMPLLLSCRGYQLVPGSRVVSAYEKCFSNDSLRFSFHTYAPYDLHVSKIDKQDKKLLRQIGIPTSAKVLFTGFNDFNHPHYLIGLLEQKGFDLTTYKRMESLPGTFYYEDAKAKLDTVPVYFKSGSVRDKQVYEAALPFEAYTARLLYVTDSVMGDKRMAEFAAYGVNFSQGATYAPCAPVNPFTLANDYFKTGDEVNYVRPLVVLRSKQSNYQSPSEKGMLYQALANYFSLVDEEDSVQYYWGKIGRKAPAKVLQKNNLQPATPQVLALAKTSPVLMFNEAHTNPAHRYYAGLLLDSLRALGFRYLAMEALGEDTTVNQRGYPNINSGFYTNEPTMANLIRHAKQLGFQLVAYDSQTSNREYAQAMNIYNKTIALDPLAKVVVWAGHGHIDESLQHDRKMMAAYFQDISGINPVTIDQTVLDNYATPDDTPPNAYVLSDSALQNMRLPLQLQADLKVYNGFNLAETNNCFAAGTSSEVSIPIPPDSLLQKQEHVLLIYKTDELTAGIQPAPTAIKYLKGNPVTVIKLCSGEYEAVVKDVFGEVVWRHKLHVD